MTRRRRLLGTALALSLTSSLALTLAAVTPASAAAPAASSTPEDPAAGAMHRLRADADGAVVVHRDAAGDVSSVSSADGGAILDSGATTPRAAARNLLSTYGDAFGIDGAGSRAQVTQTIDSATGGSVVRAQQVVDGVPVFGGQVVVSVDEHQDVSAVTAATTDPDVAVPAPVVDQATARATAVRATARVAHVDASALTATDVGRRLYDPAVVGADTRLGSRPVWQFTVSSGTTVRETVLVGTTHGEVVLAFDDVDAVDRRVCDNNSRATVATSAAVPVSCTTAARTEGAPATGVADVDAAYDSLGQASQAYDDLAGIDLTDTIGATVGGTKSLAATVRWCYRGTGNCPYDNAFWDGTQMVFGTGYATADDVVGHELTHGYVERTSNLYSIYQSGAINESVADTIGEVVDHRNGSDDDTAWTIGESLPINALRSMKDPTLSFQGQPSQPDRMTSPYFQAAEATSDTGDGGAVHRNDGVGNKTAYLISQGGSFNGQTITGIDGADPGLAKTGLLYLEAIPRLTSGADYAQLGQVLVSTCAQLADSSSAGFSAADCASVSQAAAATELSRPPTTAGAAASKVAVTCPTGTPAVLAGDDDDDDSLGLVPDGTWSRTPDDAPSYSSSGESSLFAYDPGDDTSAITGAPLTLPADGSAYLHFDQARLMAFNGSAYASGGQVLVEEQVGSTWTPVSGLPWTNGPTQVLYGRGTQVFGGDSHGYGSSQLDLSSLAGQTVRLLFQVSGVDDDTAYTGGWWVDDITVYGCAAAAPTPAVTPVTPAATPTAPTRTSVSVSGTSATLSWSAPAVSAEQVARYVVRRSDGAAVSLPPTTRRLPLRFSGRSSVSVAVSAVGSSGASSPAVSRTLYATSTSLRTSKARVKKNKPFVLTARVVRRGSSATVAGMPLVLQRNTGGGWSTVASGSSGSRGTRAWTVRSRKATAYRVVARGAGTSFASTSGSVAVRKK